VVYRIASYYQATAMALQPRYIFQADGAMVKMVIIRAYLLRISDFISDTSNPAVFFLNGTPRTGYFH
jgi:hypothetical protein